MNLDKSVLQKMVQKIAEARKKEEFSNLSKAKENGESTEEFMEMKRGNGQDSRSKQDQIDLMNCEDGTDGNEDETNQKDCSNQRKSDGQDYKIVSIIKEGNQKKENIFDSERKGLLEKIREKISARIPEKVQQKSLNVDEQFFKRFQSKILLQRKERGEKNEKQTDQAEVIEIDSSNPELKGFNNESFKVNNGILEDETQKGLFSQFIQKIKSLTSNERKVALSNKAKDFEISLTELRIWIDAFELLLKVENQIKQSRQKLSEAEISVLFAKQFIKTLKQNSSDKKYRLVKICNIVFKGLKLDSMKGVVWLTQFVKQNKSLLDFKILEQFGIKHENLKKLVKREESNSEEKGHQKNVVSQKGRPNFIQKNHNLKKSLKGQSPKVKRQFENQDSSEPEQVVKVSPIVSHKKPQIWKTKKIQIVKKEPQQKKQLKIQKKEQKEKEKIELIQKESVNALRIQMQKKLRAERQRQIFNQKIIEEQRARIEQQKLEEKRYFSQAEVRTKENESVNRLYPQSFCQKIANKLDEAFKSMITKILAEKSEELCLDEETLKKFYKEYGTYLSLGSEKQSLPERHHKEQVVERKIDKKEVVQRKTRPDITFQKMSDLNDLEMKKIEEKSNFQSQFLKLAYRSKSSLGKRIRNETIEMKKPVERLKQTLEIHDEIDHENLKYLPSRTSNMNQPQKFQFYQENFKKPTQVDRVPNGLIERLSLNSQKERFQKPLAISASPSSHSPHSLHSPLPIKQTQYQDKPSSIITNPYQYLSSKLLGFIERHQDCTENDIRKCAIKIATKSPKIQGKIKEDNLHIWIINFLQSRKNKNQGINSDTNGFLNQVPQKSQVHKNFGNSTPKIMIKNIGGEIENKKMKMGLQQENMDRVDDMKGQIKRQRMGSYSRIGDRMLNSNNNNVYVKKQGLKEYQND